MKCSYIVPFIWFPSIVYSNITYRIIYIPSSFCHSCFIPPLSFQ